MPHQNDMFARWADADLVPEKDRQPIARMSDPVTSRRAADQVTRSGRRGSQKRAVLELVRLWPGRTSAELARSGELDRYVVARRLPDLCRDGLVRRGDERMCSVTDNQAITWSSC